MPRVVYLTSQEDADFVLSGAEGSDVEVPGVTEAGLEEDLTRALAGLRQSGHQLAVELRGRQVVRRSLRSWRPRLS